MENAFEIMTNKRIWIILIMHSYEGKTADFAICKCILKKNDEIEEIFEEILHIEMTSASSFSLITHSKVTKSLFIFLFICLTAQW